MAQFQFKVRDGGGTLDTGILQAPSLVEAQAILREEGKFIVDLFEHRKSDAGAKPDVTPDGLSKIKVKRQEVVTFAHQMAMMVETGVPISEALHCISEQCTDEKFKEVLEEIAERVTAGGEFSSALAHFPKTFPAVMVSLIKASEMSGTMGSMLDRISTYMTKELQTAKTIKSAMTYPAVMMCLVLGVTIFLLTWVLPSFAGIYANKGATLPMPTRILMALSDTLIGYWWAWIIGVAALVIGLFFGLRTESGVRVLDTVKLKAPILGTMFTKLYVTRATRTMGVMINAGVQVLDMVAIVRNVTGNVLYQDLWDDIDHRLRQGGQLSEGLFVSDLMPRSVTQMIYSGEKAGRLGPTMEKIAEFTEADFDAQVESTTQYIEPLMVGIMGGIVGFVAIALLLPIFSISQVVSH